MNIDESLDLLKEIINTKERKPNMKNHDTLPGTKTYEVNDELVKLMKNYTKIYKQLRKYIEEDKLINKDYDKIAVIYLMENKKSQEIYIGYTTFRLFTFIKMNIHYYNMGEENVFTNINEPDIRWNVFKVLEYVKFEDKGFVLERKKHYVDLYEKIKKKDGEESEKIGRVNEDDLLFKLRMKIYFDIIVNFKGKIESVTGNIFALVNTVNKRLFIGGYLLRDGKEVHNRESVIEVLKSQNNIKFMQDLEKYKEGAFEFQIVEKYKAYTRIDFILRIDFIKIKLGTVEGGYNTSYSFKDSKLLFADLITNGQRRYIEKKIFPMIQQLFFERDFKDDMEYSGVYGFVYEIYDKKNNKRFFSYAINKKLKNVIGEMYDNVINKNPVDKYNKLQRAFLEVSFYDFEFKVLKVKHDNDLVMDLKTEVELLIAKNNTINNGYNVNMDAVRRGVMIARARGNRGF